jgi:hypothetical protein
MTCTACGEPLPGGAAFCGACGTAASVVPNPAIRFCPQCGAVGSTEAAFCPSCGAQARPMGDAAGAAEHGGATASGQTALLSPPPARARAAEIHSPEPGPATPPASHGGPFGYAYGDAFDREPYDGYGTHDGLLRSRRPDGTALGALVAFLLALDALFSMIMATGEVLVPGVFAGRLVFAPSTVGPFVNDSTSSIDKLFTAEMVVLVVVAATAAIAGLARASFGRIALLTTGVLALVVQVVNLFVGYKDSRFLYSGGVSFTKFWTLLFGDPGGFTAPWLIAGAAVLLIAIGALGRRGATAIAGGVLTGWATLGALAGVAVALA